MMSEGQVDRRVFLKTSAAMVTAGGLISAARRDVRAAEKAQPRIRKAVKIGMVQGDMSILDKFKLLKELGFDGVDMDSPTPMDRDEVLKARDTSGLTIHGVVDSVHWKQHFAHPDPAVRKQGLDGLMTALRDAKHWGASTVLLVPAVVNKEISYADAYKRSQEEIRKALPLAEEVGVKIAFENVWNNFLLSPLEAARYVDEFESPMVGWYFDVGNVLRYGWPEHWVATLNKRIIKLDIKEFSLKKQQNEGLWKGFEVELLEGDCDWPTVMKALKAIDYTGWGTAEIPGGGRDRLEEIAGRMDRIFAS